MVAFIGSGTGTTGIFAASGASLIEVVSLGDILDGKTVNALSFSDDRPLSGNQLVFSAGFSDGSYGLYLAQVPEPGAAALIGVLAAPLLARRRAR